MDTHGNFREYPNPRAVGGMQISSRAGADNGGRVSRTKTAYSKGYITPSKSRARGAFNMDRETAREQLKGNLRSYVEQITRKSKGANMFVCPLCGSGEGHNFYVSIHFFCS